MPPLDPQLCLSDAFLSPQIRNMLGVADLAADSDSRANGGRRGGSNLIIQAVDLVMQQLEMEDQIECDIQRAFNAQLLDAFGTQPRLGERFEREMVALRVKAMIMVHQHRRSAALEEIKTYQRGMQAVRKVQTKSKGKFDKKKRFAGKKLVGALPEGKDPASAPQTAAPSSLEEMHEARNRELRHAAGVVFVERTGRKPKVEWGVSSSSRRICALLAMDHMPLGSKAPALSSSPVANKYLAESRHRSRPSHTLDDPSDRPLRPVKRVKLETPDADGSPLSSPPDSPRMMSSAATLRRPLAVLEHEPQPSPPRAVKTERPKGRPLVWAQSRQELCEALPYYKSFQSSLYMHKRVGYAYLLDGYPSPRDIWAENGRVIISHGGGHCIRSTDAKGRPIICLDRDQSPSDARVDALLNNEASRIPIILIAGENFDQLPWKLDCAYVVLGWYWISATWVEAERPPYDTPLDEKGYYHRYKVRFDWIDSQGPPWWEHDTSLLQEDADPSQASILEHQPTGIPKRPCKEMIPGLCLDLSDRAKINHDLPTPPYTPPEATTAFARLNEPPLSVDIEGGRRRPSPAIASVHEISQPALELIEREEVWCSIPVNSDRRFPGTHLLTCFETPQISESDVNEDPFISIMTHCQSCDKASPHIYQQGWTCLTPECSRFWSLEAAGGLIPPDLRLTYNTAFLAHRRTPRELAVLPYSVVPSTPNGIPGEATEELDGRSLWRGWVCGKCGRANCRFRWEVWECRGCGDLVGHLKNERLILPTELTASSTPFFGNAIIDPTSGITVSIKTTTGMGHVMCRYTLPGKCGTIYHISPTDAAFADDIFAQYQRAANTADQPLFERRALTGDLHRCKTIAYGTVKGQLLSQQFAVNSGATYKYSVKSASLTFEQSPKCVMAALDVIKTRVAEALAKIVDFNEILSILYREGQKMSWHDDGEAGLGSVVASLSLGSPATMSWRPKAPYTERKAIMFGSQAQASRSNHEPTSLSLTLSHGDIVIMHGRRMQSSYDHRVIPQGFRVAATARVIGKDHLHRERAPRA